MELDTIYNEDCLEGDAPNGLHRRLRLRPAVHALAKGGHVHLGPVLRHRQHRLAGGVSQEQG